MAALLVIAAALWDLGGARAMPDAVPWDHAGGSGRPDCTECHFDAAAVTQSPALRLEGLPEKAVAGRTYPLVLTLEAEPLALAGFLLHAVARTTSGELALPGYFHPADGRTEGGEGAIRSTFDGARPPRPGFAEWRFSWQAPEDFVGTVTFHIAANAANDDQSPLGDGVHLMEVSREVGEGSD